jgi:hypothetical protein
MACQAASATASLREVLKAGPLCRQRTLDPKKISAMALNSTRPERDFLDPVPGSGGDAQVLQQSPMPASEDRRFSPEGLHLVSISVHLLGFGIARGRVLFVGIVFRVMVLRLLLLLSRRVLSHWTLRNHQLYLKRFLFW